MTNVLFVLSQVRGVEAAATPMSGDLIEWGHVVFVMERGRAAARRTLDAIFEERA